MIHTPYNTRLLLLAVGLTLQSALGSNWNVNRIASDIGCINPTLQASNVLESATQTQCNSSEILNYMAQVGRCMPCSAEPNGPGYYCENNRAVLCPAGYYCPTYLQKIECPEDTWCKAGFTKTMDCRTPFVTCPKGSVKQAAGVGFVIGFFMLMSCGCTCCCCIRIRNMREEERMKREAAKVLDSDHKLGADFANQTPPVEVEFDGLSMHLKTNGKCVLDDVTGKFPKSSLVALMGPSGGGKTTFMNALCGRGSYGHVTGEIKINGRPGGVTDFPRLVGFVPQDDIMHADLTVHQCILYNGFLRLPAGTPSQQVIDHTNMVVKILGMSHIAHNLIGDASKRGISGGQKKRVNIGMELVAMPAIIFMDEPTSGLDGAATSQLADCLAELRRSGLTIICVIHQPRWSVYRAFTHLLLLGAGGRMVYCGDADKMEEYFTSIFFRMPEKDNPADWMIDITCGLTPRYQGKADSSGVDESFVAPTKLFEIWDATYKRQANPYLTNLTSSAFSDVIPIEKDRDTPNIFMQAWHYLNREARKFDKSAFMTNCVILFISGAGFGLIGTSLTTDFTYKALTQSLSGSTSLYYMLLTILSRGVFGNEHLEYMREFKSGTSAFGYWLSKVIFNIIAFFMYGFCFTLPHYWLMPVPAQKFGDFFNIYCLASWYHTGLGMMISVTWRNTSTSLMMSVFIPTVIDTFFGGTMTKISDMDGPTLWGSALSCGRWLKSDLLVNELKEYPSHVLNFPDVQEQLEELRVTMDDEGVGFVMLLILGLVWRLYTLMLLLLLKYSEGGSCLAMWKFVIARQFHKFGLASLVASCLPKKGDVVEGPAVIERKPTEFMGGKFKS